MNNPPSTVSVESPRRNYKIAHVVLNAVCLFLIAEVCSEYSSWHAMIMEHTNEYWASKSTKAPVGQTSYRTGFLASIIALTLASLGVLLMHHLSRQRESYVMKPVYELIYYVASGALLITLSIFLIVRHSELQKWFDTLSKGTWVYRSSGTVATILFGFIDAIAYLVPAVQVGMNLRKE